MKMKTLAMATSLAVAGMSVAGSAQASALATSVLNISNFQITYSGGGEVTNGTGIVLGTSTDSASVSAQLGAGPATAVSIPNQPLSATPLDIPYVSQGTVSPAYTENSFSIYSTNNAPVSNFALADSLINGAPINGTPACAGPGCTAQAAQASYVALLKPGAGVSSAGDGLNTSFIFTVANPGAFKLTFDALAYLEAFTSLDSKAGSSAQSSYSLSFQLTDTTANNATVFKWAPDGTGTGGIGVNSVIDPFDLNTGVSASSPGLFTADNFMGSGAACVGIVGCAQNVLFSATTNNLVAGDVYQLKISSSTYTSATTVPEPESLALLGIGLVGVGVSRMAVRKHKKVSV